MKDEDLMPFGIHKGKKMIDVPADYLLWLLETNKCSGEVRAYILDVKDALIRERNENNSISR
jgi:uncharacterized protein (DUF3820 family)